MDKVRDLALKVLFETDVKGAYSNLALKKILSNSNFDSRDRAFITELVYGTVTWKLTLDWIISQFSKIKLKKLSHWVLEILRMGVYQILFLDRVPPSAVCNTSVELAKKHAKSSTGFVNAVLRNISRKKEQLILYDINASTTAKDFSIKYSFPEYLAEEWIFEFGKDFTEKLLSSLLERPDFSVRINTLKTTKDDLAAQLTENGIKVMAGRFLDEALLLGNVSDISSLKVFAEGKLTVQDESSMLVTKVLDPQPGDKVLDVCAAPGGKTTHIGQVMKNKGQIIAYDIHEHKLNLIRENARRLGIENIVAFQRDALIPAIESENNYNRVLVDAPCSGTGIIRRKPDIKWKRQKEDIGKLVEIQKKILYNSSRYVQPGGVLVYSTCSLDKRENQRVVTGFLSHNRDFELETIEKYIPSALKEKNGVHEGMLSLYPHIDRTDGFFISRMRRKT